MVMKYSGSGMGGMVRKATKGSALGKKAAKKPAPSGGLVRAAPKGPIGRTVSAAARSMPKKAAPKRGVKASGFKSGGLKPTRRSPLGR